MVLTPWDLSRQTSEPPAQQHLSGPDSLENADWLEKQEREGVGGKSELGDPHALKGINKKKWEKIQREKK